eukprot:Rhum_TRINITY_DN14829_c9_g2::Rhum_TRINITY_DN14829_c9_g2_i1::g.121892::m.121892
MSCAWTALQRGAARGGGGGGGGGWKEVVRVNEEEIGLVSKPPNHPPPFPPQRGSLLYLHQGKRKRTKTGGKGWGGGKTAPSPLLLPLLHVPQHAAPAVEHPSVPKLRRLPQKLAHNSRHVVAVQLQQRRTTLLVHEPHSGKLSKLAGSARAPTTTTPSPSDHHVPVPPPLQHPLHDAAPRALDALRSRRPSVVVALHPHAEAPTPLRTQRARRRAQHRILRHFRLRWCRRRRRHRLLRVRPRQRRRRPQARPHASKQHNAQHQRARRRAQHRILRHFRLRWCRRHRRHRRLLRVRPRQRRRRPQARPHASKQHNAQHQRGARAAGGAGAAAAAAPVQPQRDALVPLRLLLDDDVVALRVRVAQLAALAARPRPQQRLHGGQRRRARQACTTAVGRGAADIGF